MTGEHSDRTRLTQESGGIVNKCIKHSERRTPNRQGCGIAQHLNDCRGPRGLDPKNLSRTIEDAATVWEPILPWTSAGAYMAGTLGVATLAYMPWAISNWIAIFFALVWAATGISIAKLTPEEQKALEAEG